MKRKFGQSTRDAMSQLEISAKLIYDDIFGSGGKTLVKLYAILVKNVERKKKLVAWGVNDENQFVDLFRKSELTFVYAVVDEHQQTTKKTLKEESERKTIVEKEDLKEKLEDLKKENSKTFKLNAEDLCRIVFKLNDFDSEYLETLAKDLFEFLVKEKFIESDGEVTSKLLFGQFNLEFSARLKTFFNNILNSFVWIIDCQDRVGSNTQK